MTIPNQELHQKAHHDDNVISLTSELDFDINHHVGHMTMAPR